MPKKVFALLLLMASVLAACSYDSEQAMENGDVINMHGPVFNFERFEQFLNQVEAEEPASVRISNFLLTGNPTLYDVSFDGTAFNLEVDRSKNKERGEDPAKMSLSCKELVSSEGEQLFTYTLEGCQKGASDDSFTLLTVMKEDDHNHGF